MLINQVLSKNSQMALKFKYSEKATKFGPSAIYNKMEDEPIFCCLQIISEFYLRKFNRDTFAKSPIVVQLNVSMTLSPSLPPRPLTFPILIFWKS